MSFFFRAAFCFISFRKNQAFRTSTIVPSSSSFRSCGGPLRGCSNPCRSLMQQTIVTSFLTLHTIVDCIVPAKTRGINCFSTSVRTSIADSTAPTASLTRSRPFGSVTIVDCAALPQKYFFFNKN